VKQIFLILIFSLNLVLFFDTATKPAKVNKMAAASVIVLSKKNKYCN